MTNSTDNQKVAILLQEEITKLRQIAANPNDQGQVLVHRTHLRGIAAQLENAVLPALNTSKHE